jgi:hypothetical protein
MLEGWRESAGPAKLAVASSVVLLISFGLCGIAFHIGSPWSTAFAFLGAFGVLTSFMTLLTADCGHWASAINQDQISPMRFH